MSNNKSKAFLSVVYFFLWTLTVASVNAYFQENIALNKNVTQSSNLSYPYVGDVWSAGNAVDGNKECTIFDKDHYSGTANELVSWWQVDLGNIYSLSTIIVYDHYSLSQGFQVYLLTSENSQDKQHIYNNTDYGNGVFTIPVKQHVFGRYVRIEIPTGFLLLCEVEVYPTVTTNSNANLFGINVIKTGSANMSDLEIAGSPRGRIRLRYSKQFIISELPRSRGAVVKGDDCQYTRDGISTVADSSASASPKTPSSISTLPSFSQTPLTASTTTFRTLSFTTTALSTIPTISSTRPVSVTPDCQEPPTLENGIVHKNGSVATYYCKPGYIGGNVSIKCQHGSWEHLSVTCSPVECRVLPPYSNASITYFPRNTSHFGTVAVLQCQTGYAISNTSKSTTFRCNETATWNGNISVTCKRISCRTLDLPVNGNLSEYNTTVASLVRYICNKGYTLKGFESRVCLDSGEWSRTSPTCNKDPEKPEKPCPAGKDSRQFDWNETKAGQSLSIPCSSYNQNLSGEITRVCTNEGEWLLPNYNCTRKEVEVIKNAVNEIKDNPSESKVEEVLGDLSILTNQSTNETTYAGELQAITESLQVIADINYTNIELTKKQSKAFLETTSNLLDPSNAESWQSIHQESADEEEVSGASKMLNVVSKYTDAIANSLDDSEPKRTIPTANLILQVRLLNNSEDITFPDENDNVSSSSSLVLSKNALKGSTKYSAIIYKNLSGVLSTKASSNSEDLELGSSVMSVKLNNWQNSDFGIRMTFEYFKKNDLEPRCSFRNESRNNWETAGCERRSFNSSTTICECNHLTNFAILMSPWTEENVETKAIRIISIIGCSVSVVCLLLTILAHMCFWRYVRSDRVKILMNLCIALLISYGLFLGGVDRTSNKDVCTTIAVLLQYIYLVVFFFMLAEGIEISFVVLFVFLTKSRLKWILPCAWFIPALIVGISLAVTQTKGYGNSEFCWLSVDNGLIWAFVGPALLIILVNFLLLVLILKTIFRAKTLAQKSNKERTMAGVRCLCVLLPLVGCTWVIGIFYVNESMAWIQYVFAVCNSLQGLAIFIFHCALNTQLKHAFQRRRRLSESAYTSSSSNAFNLIPRAKTSQTATDIYCSIGSETTLHRSRPSSEMYETAVSTPPRFF